MEGTQKSVMVVTCFLLVSTEAAPEQDQGKPNEEMPTLVPYSEPEQAPGTAVTELPVVKPPAALEQLNSAPVRPVVLGPGPQHMSAAKTQRVPPNPFICSFKIFVFIFICLQFYCLFLTLYISI